MKKTIFVVFLALVLCCLGVYAAANAGVDQNVTEDTIAVTLNGLGSSGMAPLFYVWTQLGGKSVTLENPTTATPSFTANEPGTYEFRLQVTDSSSTPVISTDDVKVFVKRLLKLEITDLDVKVGSESENNIEDVSDGYIIRDEAKPEDTVRFDVKVKSLFNRDLPEEEDIDIENIVVTITIEGIDDGDDLEEESDEFDLRPERDESVSLSFDVPLQVDHGDTYDVKIEIEGEDTDGVTHRIEKTLVLEIQKDNHYIRIYRFNINPATVACTRSATVDVEIMNLGRDDEDEVTLEIMNQELGINSRTTDIEMSYDYDDDDNTFDKTLTITLPEGFKAGTYPISVKSFYDSKLSETKTVDLVVEECKPVVTEPVEETPEETEVVVTPPEEIPEDVVPAEPVVEENVPAFMQSSEFYTLVVIVIVLVIGLIIFLIGAFVIRASKK
jgi:hypothetical protein